MMKEKLSYILSYFKGSMFRSLDTTDSFYYALTGDTQYWFPCTPTNEGCLTNVVCPNAEICTKLQSEYANRVQHISLVRLNETLGEKLKGIIINGDLTQFGHEDELTRFKTVWINNPPAKIFPGLGNHDYANNVDECFLNHCAKRMLAWLVDYLTGTLRISPDFVREVEEGWYENYFGSFAYSWSECAAPGKCIRFVQMNNYPTYKREINRVLAEWHVQSSLFWLKRELAQHPQDAFVFNFHDYDTDFQPNDKEKLREILEQSPNQILGVFFAHFHTMVGLRDIWCLRSKPVPFFYSGSVPANNYVLVQFNAKERTMGRIYKFYVKNEVETAAEEIQLPTQC